jgi:hypothetical protein
MTQVAYEPTLERPPLERWQEFDEIENDARGASRQEGRVSTMPGPRTPARIRLPLRQRYALRDAIAYAVEAPAGEIGFVTEVRFAPFEFWPDELIVEAAPEGRRLRIPIDTITAVFPREGRLLIATTPAGAQPVARPREGRLTKARAWRLAAAAGAVFALGGYVATLVAFALGTLVSWSPALAASGAAGGAAAVASWRKLGRSRTAAIGLGSFWLPLAVGAILSFILIFA